MKIIENTLCLDLLKLCQDELHSKLKKNVLSVDDLRNNNFYFLEINTNPGLTKESILPQQAISYGISLKELFKNLIN